MPSFTPKVSKTVKDRLVEARNSTGLSTRAVASKLSARYSVSHATLANYESGRSSPPLEVLVVLASVYGRPLTWFFENSESLTGVQYRNTKSKVRQQDKVKYEGAAKKWLEGYGKIERRVGRPLQADPRFKGFRAEPGEAGEALARRLRERLRLQPNQPVQSTIEVLEKFGIRVIEVKTDDHIDGIAARLGSDYVIALNPPQHANDRARMSAAHELGHVLFGDVEGERPATRAKEKELENRAYDFACFFLLPKVQLERAFQGRSMLRLLEFKERFGIALSAMVYRAEKEGVINPKAARWLWMQFSQRGWRTQEPGYVWRDRATRFERLLESAILEKRLTWRESELVTGIPETELRRRIAEALGGDIEPEEGTDDAQILKIAR